MHHKYYTQNMFTDECSSSTFSFCFTWYDMVIWECLRHWKGQLITIVWSRKSALHGYLNPQQSGGGFRYPLQRLLAGCAFGPAKSRSKWWLAWSQLEHTILELNPETMQATYKLATVVEESVQGRSPQVWEDRVDFCSEKLFNPIY